MTDFSHLGPPIPPRLQDAAPPVLIAYTVTPYPGQYQVSMLCREWRSSPRRLRIDASVVGGPWRIASARLTYSTGDGPYPIPVDCLPGVLADLIVTCAMDLAGELPRKVVFGDPLDP